MFLRKSLARSLILFVFAFASIAQAAATVGTGVPVAVAGGAGVDLLLWQEGTQLKAMRFATNGAPLDSTAIVLPFPADREPVAAWDGSGFVIAWATEDVAVVRIATSGGASFAMTIPAVTRPYSASAASLRQGNSVVTWSGADGTFTTLVSATGEVGLVDEIHSMRYADEIVRSNGEYILAGIAATCRTNICTLDAVRFQRIDASGGSVGPLAAFPSRIDLLGHVSYVGATRPIIVVSDIGIPRAHEVFSIEPAAYRAARTTIRFPEPLTAQETATGPVLIGLGARIDLAETGAPQMVNWSPLPAGQRLAAVLPSSGMRILAPESGAGTISVEAPATDVSEVGLTTVFVQPDTVWLKIDNRGPDPARVIDLWVTLPVKQFSSAIRGTLTRVGPFTRIRFEPMLVKGAGFEVAMYFDGPIDPAAVEGWVLTSGTDRVASNNYVSTLPAPPPEPEPEPPARRRLVGR